MIHPYARQWFHPRVSLAFDPALLKADDHAKQGETAKALSLYKQLRPHSAHAEKRLALAKYQIHKKLYTPSEKNKIKVTFVDWYAGFNPYSNFLTPILEALCHDIQVCESLEECDVLIAGCYGSDLIEISKTRQEKLVLFVSGENLLPSFDIHDFSLTTLPQKFCNKNARWPQWYGELDFKSSRVTYKYQASYSKFPSKRDLLITSIYNNSTPLREETIALLKNSFGADNVHVFGSHRCGEVDKFEILTRSKINLCFENSIGDGYCTEKLLHALSFGCSAAYWGDISFKNDFMADSVFNYHENQNTNELINWISERLNVQYSTSIIPLTQIVKTNPTLDSVINHIHQWLNIILNFRGGK